MLDVKDKKRTKGERLGLHDGDMKQETLVPCIERLVRILFKKKKKKTQSEKR